MFVQRNYPSQFHNNLSFLISSNIYQSSIYQNPALFPTVSHRILLSPKLSHLILSHLATSFSDFPSNPVSCHHTILSRELFHTTYHLLTPLFHLIHSCIILSLPILSSIISSNYRSNLVTSDVLAIISVFDTF